MNEVRVTHTHTVCMVAEAVVLVLVPMICVYRMSCWFFWLLQKTFQWIYIQKWSCCSWWSGGVGGWRIGGCGVWFITPVSSQECSVGSGTQPRPVWLFPGCRCRSGPASHGQPFPRTFICPGLKLIHQLGWNYCQSWSGYNQPGLWGRIGGKKDKENRKKGKIVCRKLDWWKWTEFSICQKCLDFKWYPISNNISLSVLSVDVSASK